MIDSSEVQVEQSNEAICADKHALENEQFILENLSRNLHLNNMVSLFLDATKNMGQDNTKEMIQNLSNQLQVLFDCKAQVWFGEHVLGGFGRQTVFCCIS